MEITRTELMPGVWLNHLRSDKFKTACMSLTLLTQLKRDSASMNALIPYVLRRGTTRYGDMEALSARLEELYGAAVEPVVRRIGEIQCVGFYASLPEREYLPGGQDVLRDTAELMVSCFCRRLPGAGCCCPSMWTANGIKCLTQSAAGSTRNAAILCFAA